MTGDFMHAVRMALPIAFDYAAGRVPEVDAMVERLISQGYNVFVHFWPEADLETVPGIRARARLGWNQEGIGVRISGADSFSLLAAFPRRIAINLEDAHIGNVTHYSDVDVVLCREASLAAELVRAGFKADILSFEALLRAMIQLLPAEDEILMHDAPPFSVVLEAGSRADLLEMALASVSRQRYTGAVETLVACSASHTQAEEIRAVCRKFDARCITSETRQGERRAGITPCLKSASGAYILIMQPGIALSPWHLLGCARAFRSQGYRIAVYARRDLALRPCTAETISGSGFESAAIPSPYRVCGSPVDNPYDIDPTNIAVHRSAVLDGAVYPAASTRRARAVEFACALRRRGFELQQIGRCAGVPGADDASSVEEQIADEESFLSRYPYMILAGTCRTALEPADAGRVSMVVPVHLLNPARVARIVRLLRTQIYPGEIEIVISDDASPRGDRIAEICREAGARYVRTERDTRFPDISHLARVRNVGFNAASGEFIAFVDQDIVLPPTYVQNCVNILRFHGDRRVCHAPRVGLVELLRHADVTPSTRFHLSTSRVIELLHAHAAIERIPMQNPDGDWTHVYGHNFFVPRRLLDEVGAFDEDYVGYGAEDLDLACRMHLAGIRFSRFSDLWVYHVGHPRQERSPAVVETCRRNYRRLFAKLPAAAAVPHFQEWANA